MSLINKMLQDLDARGPQAGAGQQAEVRPVTRRERSALPRAALLGALALLLAGAAAFGWQYMQRRQAPMPLAPKVLVVLPAVLPPVAPAAPPAPVEVEVAQLMAPPRPVAGARAKPDRTVSRPAEIDRSVDRKAPGREPAKSPAAAAAEPVPAQGKLVNVQQRAENEYRRALGSLQEGRGGEAIAGLEQALAIDPRHQAARETLIRLLLEGRRQDEAMRHLQLGLGLDPAQPAMAMMLARWQMEKGGPAVETLQRTLPFALGNGEYRAFLAAVLQHGQRHREAAEQYELALRTAPQNGVWWMGLGISLQAEQRLAEAKDAFTRARAAGNLTPELETFVERKLQQLPH